MYEQQNCFLRAWQSITVCYYEPSQIRETRNEKSKNYSFLKLLLFLLESSFSTCQVTFF